jgi:Glycosyltransferase family 87
VSRRTAWAIPAALILAIFGPVIWPVPIHLGDWFQFWYIGHIAASGASPYDPASFDAALHAYGPVAHGFAVNTQDQSFAPGRFLYPPWTALALAPFGALPLETGIVLMHIALIAASVAAVALFARALPLRSTWTLGLALAMSAAFGPLVVAARTGHFAGALLLGLYLVGEGLRRSSAVRFAAGAMLLALKPHLFLGLALILLVVLVRGRQTRILALSAGLLTSLAVVGFALFPVPFATLVDTGRAKIGFDLATTPNLAAALAPGASIAALVILLAIATALGWVAIRRSAPESRSWMLLATATALSLVFAPYVQNYDLAVLVPALYLVAVAGDATHGPKRAAILAGAVLIGVFLPWLTYFGFLVVGSQAPSALVPLAFLALLAATSAHAVPAGSPGPATADATPLTAARGRTPPASARPPA